MDKNQLIEVMDAARQKQQGIQSNNTSDDKPDIKKKPKKSPHLALCSDSNPSANNRHNSLLMKSKEVGGVSLVKSEEEAQEFEGFCKTLTTPSVLLDLYLFCKQSGEHNFIESLININKE